MKAKSLNNISIENIESLQINEKFFENCIDLIPARIYLNVDDRKQWFKLLNKDVDDADDEDDSDSDKEKEEEEEEFESVDNSFNKKNKSLQIKKQKHSRFDPIYYKTVSQLYKELEKCKILNKPVDFENVKNIQKKSAAASDQDEEGLKKRKMVKVENKNQSSGSGGGAESKEKKKEETNGHNKSKKKVSKKQQEKKQKRKHDNQNLELTQSSGDDTMTNGKTSPNGSHKRQILNQSGQIVYSKFDFSVDGVGNSSNGLKNGNHSSGIGSKPKHSKLNASSNVKPKDYKVLVKKLQEKKDKMTKLKETEPEKAFEMETNDKWRTALDKASGIKVKDDIDLLKRSIKRVEKKKDKTRKEWSERVQKVEYSKQKAQEKRNKNIEIRKDKKKEKKVKRLKKRGRLLPGF